MKTVQFNVPQLVRLAVLVSVGLILFLFEALAPRILPWMKLGLGHIVIMVALLAYGAAAALIVALVKLFVGGLISGTIGSPAFVIGGGAGLVSLLTMAVVRTTLPGLFSTIGLSTMGALSHQIAQLLLAQLYLGLGGLIGFLPVFLVWGLVSGTLIGLLVHWTMGKLRARIESN